MIDAAGTLVLPGFVDTHRHTWQTAMRGICADWTLLDYFRGMRLQISARYGPEDVYAGNYVGALEALDGGVTTLLDFSHCINSPDHADEAVRGLTDAGVRAIFAYGMFPVPLSSRLSPRPRTGSPTRAACAGAISPRAAGCSTWGSRSPSWASCPSTSRAPRWRWPVSST